MQVDPALPKQQRQQKEIDGILNWSARAGILLLSRHIKNEDRAKE